MDVHIGQEIKKALAESGMSKAEFARRMNMSSQNVYKIFNRPHIDTEVLQRACHVLKSDFFAVFSRSLGFTIYTEPALLQAAEPAAAQEYLHHIISAKEAYIKKLEALVKGRV